MHEFEALLFSDPNILAEEIEIDVLKVLEILEGFNNPEEINDNPDRCPVCGGKKAAGTTTFAVDFAFGVVMVRDVPATVCSLCGADWIGD
ncbi:MAG: DUF4276 family protein, partial [Pseudomonadota bacterium]